MFVLKTGCRWRDVPREYGTPATCHRRLLQWQKQGVWTRILRVLLGQLRKRGRLKLTHGVLDGSFAPAKKGALLSAERAAD
jgi:transposase